MRLLKVSHNPTWGEKLEPIEEFGASIPEYAILSHTWGRDEVIYQDVCANTAPQRAGYAKVLGTLQQASQDGFKYLWIDSCCIDKTSSAELSEALNSMYAWYRKAARCYALLEDVAEAHSEDFRARFLRSRWFTRGWTLQELLAPRHIEFFGIGQEKGSWTSLGNRNSLQTLISERTSIDVDYLTGLCNVHHASVAKRMSWAAGRQTKREEDIAYCLLGLFSVNMPMLYGEGARAFLRLQEEIMKHSDDQSIFAWTFAATPKDEKTASHVEQEEGGSVPPLRSKHGLLADSPADFARSGSIVPWSDSKDRIPYEMSNMGLSIELRLTPQQDNLIGAALECHLESQDDMYLGILLVRLGEGSKQFARVECERLCRGSVVNRGKPERLYVRQDASDEGASRPAQFVSLRELRCLGDTYEATDITSIEPSVTPAHQQDADRRHYPHGTSQARLWIIGWSPTVFKMPSKPRELITAITLRRKSDGGSFVILIGTITDSHLGFALSDPVSRDGTGSQLVACPDFRSLQACFRLQATPASTTLKADEHEVEAAVRTYVELGRKIYVVDLQVKSTAKPPSHVTELAKQVFHKQQQQQVQQQPTPAQRERKKMSWLPRPHMYSSNK